MSETLHTCPKCRRAGFTEKGLKVHRCGEKNPKLIIVKNDGSWTPTPDKPSPQKPKPAVENVAKGQALKASEAILSTSAEAIRIHHERIERIHGKAQDEALLPALCIGLHCFKAHVVFAINPGKGGRPKKPSTVDGLSQPGGFEGWLVTLNDLKQVKLSKGSAYRSMTALRGLGLDQAATEKQIANALRKLRSKGPVTLKSLCDAAVEAIGPPPPPPENLEQVEFNFLRDSLAAYREQSESLLGLKEQLTGCPDLLKAACARAYATLSALTGTNWTPSDEPDDLATVDPDSITL